MYNNNKRGTETQDNKGRKERKNKIKGNNKTMS